MNVVTHRTQRRQASFSHTKPFTNMLTMENTRLLSLYLFYKTHTYINCQNHKYSVLFQKRPAVFTTAYM